MNILSDTIVTIEKGISIPQSRMLELLRDSVIHSLENGKKASKFPTLHAYLEMDGEDIPNPTVKKLREEFVKLKEFLPDLKLGVFENDKFIGVDKISGMAYASNPDAGLFLRNVGVPVEFPAKNKITELIDMSISTCDEAIQSNCGVGKYSS